MEIPERNSWKRAENRTLKAGSSPPRAEMAIFKWLFLKALGSKTLDSIESRAPPSDVPIEIQDHSRRHSSGSTIPYRRLDPKDGCRW